MKKTIAMLLSLLALGASAQEKGRFEVHNYDQFKLHIYYTQDAMDDASFIIEGKEAVVTLEEPLFKVHAAAFDAYLSGLKKPVEKRIFDYHLGGNHDDLIVMPEGMPKYASEGHYAEMMNRFAKQYGDAIVVLPNGPKEEVPSGSTQRYAGVAFAFIEEVGGDSPATNILIGDKVWYMHSAPVKTHPKQRQIRSIEAIDTQIAFFTEALNSGATLFIGSHGQAVTSEVIQFQIDYLKKLKSTWSEQKTAAAFVAAMKQAYPNLPGERDLEGVANALYQK
ncbi:MAG: hypothetical protein ACI3ZY_01065 [Parabacteroides sp.]